MTDAEIVKTISEGVTEGGKESMKPCKDALTKEALDALVGYVRKFNA